MSTPSLPAPRAPGKLSLFLWLSGGAIAFWIGGFALLAVILGAWIVSLGFAIKAFEKSYVELQQRAEHQKRARDVLSRGGGAITTDLTAYTARLEALAAAIDGMVHVELSVWYHGDGADYDHHGTGAEWTVCLSNVPDPDWKDSERYYEGDTLELAVGRAEYSLRAWLAKLTRPSPPPPEKEPAITTDLAAYTARLEALAAATGGAVRVELSISYSIHTPPRDRAQWTLFLPAEAGPKPEDQVFLGNTLEVAVASAEYRHRVRPPIRPGGIVLP